MKKRGKELHAHICVCNNKKNCYFFYVHMSYVHDGVKRKETERERVYSHTQEIETTSFVVQVTTHFAYATW